MTVHKNLTGADLHEPKGVATALAGQVYVSDGTGSGVWTSAASVITNTAFSTGDAKITLKTTADVGWIIFADGTIGDASSGASTRANADTQSLFALLWTINDAYAPVSGGRGASAAADYAAHKTIGTTRVLGRMLAISGSGTGLSTRPLGAFTGSETVTITQANFPNISLAGTVTDPGHQHNLRYDSGSTYGNQGVPQNAIATLNVGGGAGVNITAAFTGISVSTALGGSNTPMTVVNPVSYWNIMVKL